MKFLIIILITINNIYIDTYIIQYINNYYKNLIKLQKFSVVYIPIHDIKMKI